MDDKASKKIRSANEKIIKRAGLGVNKLLPMIDTTEEFRSIKDFTDRALVLNALVNVYFKAPISLVKTWIDTNNCASALSNSERKILEKTNDQLTKQENIDLYWKIEGLYTFAWAGRFYDTFAFESHIPNTLASLFPSLQKNESGDKFRITVSLREQQEIYEQLDLYFRLHWYARDCQLRGKSPGPANIDAIMERRRALEWIHDKNQDWDNIDLST